MLNKLIKYDLKYMTKNMSVFYILSLFFAILTKIFSLLKQTTFIFVLDKILACCMWSMVFSILFNTIIRSWIRFKDFIYKDESYLTHTLPITKTEIYESKFIQTLIFSLVGFLVMVLSVFIAFYSKDNIDLLKSFMNVISTSLDVKNIAIIICTLLLLFLEIINGIQAGYFGIILGFRKENAKIGFSFLYGTFGYLLSQGLIVLSIVILGLFNKNIMKIFSTSVMLNSSDFKFLIVFAIIMYIIVISIINVISSKLLNKGVNID